MVKLKKYYLLQETPDDSWNGSYSITLAWIDANTTKKQRIKLADKFTNGQFSKYPSIYTITKPIKISILK